MNARGFVAFRYKGRMRGGVIYLLHFKEPLEHAQHYIGFCHSLEKLPERLGYHRRGNGSKLLRAVMLAGGDFECVRVFVGSKTDERRLKNRHYAPRLCPMCQPSPVIPKDCEQLQPERWQKLLG